MSLLGLPVELLERILLEAALPHSPLSPLKENWHPGTPVRRYSARRIRNAHICVLTREVWCAAPWIEPCWLWSTQTALLCTNKARAQP